MSDMIECESKYKKNKILYKFKDGDYKGFYREKIGDEYFFTYLTFAEQANVSLSTAMKWIKKEVEDEKIKAIFPVKKEVKTKEGKRRIVSSYAIYPEYYFYLLGKKNFEDYEENNMKDHIEEFKKLKSEKQIMEECVRLNNECGELKSKLDYIIDLVGKDEIAKKEYQAIFGVSDKEYEELNKCWKSC